MTTTMEIVNVAVTAGVFLAAAFISGVLVTYVATSRRAHAKKHDAAL